MAIINRNIADTAKIESTKLDFGLATAPTELLNGIAPFDGMMYYNTATNMLMVYDGSTWVAASIPGSFAGDLDSVVAAGKKVTNTSAVEFEKSDAAMLLIVDQNGNGGCLTLENAGTGDTLALDDGGTTWLQLGTGGAKTASLSNAGVLNLLDNTLIKFGTGNDITMKFDATDLLVEWGAADTGEIAFGKTTNGDMSIYGDTNTDYVRWDTSAEKMSLNGFDLNLEDSDILEFGDGQDITMTFNGTKFVVDCAADDTLMEFGDGTTSFDIKIYGAAATDLITFDASANLVTVDDYDFTFTDDTVVSFGTGKDVTVTFDATDLIVDGPVADIQVKVGATNNLDLIIYGDTATDLITFDTSAELVTFNGFDLRIQDADILSFGDADDITIRWDATDLLIDGAAADTIIKIGATNNQDIIIYGDTVTDLITFDTSAEDVQFNGFDLTLMDADILNFGDADDITMTWDATQFVINAAAADSAVHLGVDDAGLDLKFFGATASAYMLWDQSADSLVFGGAAYILPKYQVVAKTTSYSVLAGDFGKIFTTRGAAGAVTFTLPASSGNSGGYVEFYNVADQNMIIDGTDEELVVFNDLTADSIAFQTASEKIGGGFKALCDGTSWVVVPVATETQTVTVVSA